VIAAAVFAGLWSPAVLRFGIAAAVNYQLALLVALMAVLAWFSGGLGAPPLYAYVLIPTLGVALLGRTPAIVWSAIACLVLGGFLVLELTGHSPPPSGVAPEALTRGHAVLGALGIGLSLAFTLLQDAHRRRVLVELEQALVHAEVANRAKSAFLANVGHELRTPMTGVLGMSSLLQAEEIAPQHREMAAVIEKSAGSLLTLLDDILDYAQIEGRQLAVEAKAFEVRDLVRETVALVAPLADHKGLALSDRIDASVPGRMLGDARRTRQILLNLLGNAIKFTDAGSVKLDLTAEPGEEPTTLVLRVRDTGRGIPEDARTRIFERFERVDQAGVQPVPGSGLGLAICRGLLDLMGGEMGVESAAGVGSCFVVRLPMTVAPDETAAGVAVPSSVRLPEGLNVLVAEDNRVNQMVTCKLLERMGHSVVIADSGGAA
jgi:signal transduction histidine kinase